MICITSLWKIQNIIIDLSQYENKLEALENLPNNELLLRFSIPGRPSTKKTSQRVVRRGRIYQNSSILTL